MSNKTPYEIRLDVLRMAQDAEMQKYYDQRERVLELWRMQADVARASNQPIPPQPELPVFPTQESVVNKAQYLGEFINNSDKKVL
tara:strand:+ start:236 stop:490 length:255 start_codon:yes stop_codon:yes gene_type:complete